MKFARCIQQSGSFLKDLASTKLIPQKVHPYLQLLRRRQPPHLLLNLNRFRPLTIRDEAVCQLEFPDLVENPLEGVRDQFHQKSL